MHTQLSNKMQARLSIEPHLNRMQQEVYEVLCSRGKQTCEQIATELSSRRHKTVHPHQITPRLGELLALNMIYIDGSATALSGRKVNVYRSKEEIKQYNLFGE